MQKSHWNYAPSTPARSVGRVPKARSAMSPLAWDIGMQRAQMDAANNESVDDDLFDFFRRQRYNFSGDSPTRFLSSAVILCDVLGALCLLLNLFVISALIRNRKRVLKNVFYVIVLHCAIVDLIRGSCLIAWGMPHLLMQSMGRVEDRLLGLKLNQFTLVILRSCNLLTIFNLLVFTTNEFIVIRHPLHYRRYFRRRTVLLILLASWIVSLTFGIGSVFTNFPASAHSVLVRNFDNGTFAFDIPPESVENGTDDGVTRRVLDGISVNMISMLMIFALCYACLGTVLVCYGIILRTIRQFHAVDNNKGAFHSEDSQRVCQRSLQNRESRRESNTSQNTTNGTKRCNSHRRWRVHLMARHKYLIVIGTVLFVDILFLLPYSAIQMVAFLYLNNLLSSSSNSTLLRWSLQIIIGVHSVCQPLCYFRMNEFRRLACGHRRSSQSFSHWQKSFAQTKDQPNADAEEGQEGEEEEEKCHSPQPDEALLSDEPQCGPSLDTPNLFYKDASRSRQSSFKFRSYGTREPLPIMHKLSELTGLHSSTHFEHEPESNV